MIIGLTYDLRHEYLAMGYSEAETAEFDRTDTVDALEHTLRGLGHEPARIGNARQLTKRLVDGERWALVFNIAEGLNGIGREAQVPAILDLYGIPYTFSDPLVMCLTLHKGMTKRVIRDAGLATADFQIIESRADLEGVTFPPPFFVKPAAEGTGRGISPQSIVRNREDLKGVCESLLAEFHQPVLVERFLPGREFTVGITGTGPDARVLGTMEIILLDHAEKEVYSYVNKKKYEDLVTYRLVGPEADAAVRKAEELSLASWKILGCRDGGRIDVRCDENGEPCFMEVNPLAGLHPEHSDLPILCSHLGIPYVGLIEQILASALKRIQPNEGRRPCA